MRGRFPLFMNLYSYTRGVKEKMKYSKVLVFTVVTYILSWTLAGVSYLLGVRYNTPASFIVTIGYMFVPMIVALLLQIGIYKEPVKAPLGLSFRLNPWWLVAWLLPPAVSFATIGVSLIHPRVEYSPQMAGFIEKFRALLPPEQIEAMEHQIGTARIHPLIAGTLQGLVAGPTINAVAGFGEELGWRGYLQKETKGLGFYRSSILIGIIWGFWHAPIILQGHNYPEHPAAGVFMMVVWCALLAPIFSLVRIRTESVIAASVLHGSLNATAGLAIMVIDGGTDLLIGVTGLSGFCVLLIVNILLWLHDRFLSRTPVMLRAAGRTL
jgi:membrane protease YdiL (CAAX protease family)